MRGKILREIFEGKKLKRGKKNGKNNYSYTETSSIKCSYLEVRGNSTVRKRRPEGRRFVRISK